MKKAGHQDESVAETGASLRQVTFRSELIKTPSENKIMEQSAIEKEIRDKAREWAEEYGEGFLVELVGDYLYEASARVARLCQALAGGDADTLTYEAHTLKSSSANVGAQTFADLAQRFEAAGREGNLAALADDVELFERQFAAVKASLEKLRSAPSQFIAQER